MKTSENGISFIKLREGFRPKKYIDGKGFSIGYGTYIDTAAEQYLLTATITEKQGDALLRDDLFRFEIAINKAVKARLTQSQFDALASLCYNIGSTAFANLYLVKLINSGANQAEIVKQWLVTYTTSKGVTLESLKNRRLLESNLYSSGSSVSSFWFLIILVVILIIYYTNSENGKS